MCDGQRGAAQDAVAQDFSDRAVRIRQLCRDNWLVEVERGAAGLESLRLVAQDGSYDRTVQVSEAERGPIYLLFKFPIARSQQPAICRLYCTSGGQTVMVWKGLRMPDQREPGEARGNGRVPRLNRVLVKVDAADARPSHPARPVRPADAGTHVYLDVAGKYDQGCTHEGFKFNHFEVRQDHRLGISGGGEVCLPDPTLLIQGRGAAPRYNTYWCYWSTGALSVPAAGGFTEVSNRYPIPARLGSDFHLVLPTFKNVSLRIYRLTSATEATIRGHVRQANTFLNKMRVRLLCDFHTLPATLQGQTHYIGRDPVRFCMHGVGADPSPSAMNIQQWMSTAPPGQKCIVVVYVEGIDSSQQGSRVPGLSRMVCRLVPRRRRVFERCDFTPPADHGLIFMDGVLGNGDHLKHEVGHIMLDTYGRGASYMGDASVGVRSRATARLQTLGLDREGDRPRDLSQRGQRLYALIQDGSHVAGADLQRASYAEQTMGPGQALPVGSNLMHRLGGGTILPWQVALFRAAWETGEGTIHT